jgi:hypothetical protein
MAYPSAEHLGHIFRHIVRDMLDDYRKSISIALRHYQSNNHTTGLEE